MKGVLSFIVFFLLVARAKALIVFEQYTNNQCTDPAHKTSSTGRAGLPAEATSRFFYLPLEGLCLDLDNQGDSNGAFSATFSNINVSHVTFCLYSEPMCNTLKGQCQTAALGDCVLLELFGYTSNFGAGWGKFRNVAEPGYVLMRGINSGCPYPPTFPVFPTFTHRSNNYCVSDLDCERGVFLYPNTQGRIVSCLGGNNDNNCTNATNMCTFQPGVCNPSTHLINTCISYPDPANAPLAYGYGTGDYVYLTTLSGNAMLTATPTFAPTPLPPGATYAPSAAPTPLPPGATYAPTNTPSSAASMMSPFIGPFIGALLMAILKMCQ